MGCGGAGCRVRGRGCGCGCGEGASEGASEGPRCEVRRRGARCEGEGEGEVRVRGVDARGREGEGRGRGMGFGVDRQHSSRPEFVGFSKALGHPGRLASGVGPPARAVLMSWRCGGVERWRLVGWRRESGCSIMSRPATGARSVWWFRVTTMWCWSRSGRSRLWRRGGGRTTAVMYWWLRGHTTRTCTTSRLRTGTQYTISFERWRSRSGRRTAAPVFRLASTTSRTATRTPGTCTCTSFRAIPTTTSTTRATSKPQPHPTNALPTCGG